MDNKVLIILCLGIFLFPLWGEGSGSVNWLGQHPRQYSLLTAASYKDTTSSHINVSNYQSDSSRTRSGNSRAGAIETSGSEIHKADGNYSWILNIIIVVALLIIFLLGIFLLFINTKTKLKISQ